MCFTGFAPHMQCLHTACALMGTLCKQGYCSCHISKLNEEVVCKRKAIVCMKATCRDSPYQCHGYAIPMFSWTFWRLFILECFYNLLLSLGLLFLLKNTLKPSRIIIENGGRVRGVHSRGSTEQLPEKIFFTWPRLSEPIVPAGLWRTFTNL